MKAKIRIGYNDFVMDLDQAVALAKTIMTAEKWESHYKTSSESATGKGGYVYNAYEQSDHDLMSIELISDDTYRIAKLRGKPDDK